MFLFSTFSAWYEGSELRDKTWEWNYSAIFSKWKHGTVTNASEISGFDHFIYAAKFKPLYPILMTISMLYILVLIATWLLRKHTNKLVIFFSILGLSLILASLLTYKISYNGSRIVYLVVCFNRNVEYHRFSYIEVKITSTRTRDLLAAISSRFIQQAGAFLQDGEVLFFISVKGRIIKLE